MMVNIRAAVQEYLDTPPTIASYDDFMAKVKGVPLEEVNIVFGEIMKERTAKNNGEHKEKSS